MSQFIGLFDIRDFKPEDTNFVLATLFNGVYYGDPRFKNVPKATFMKNYKAVGESYIKNTDKTTIKIACLKEDPDTILGYSILSADFMGIKWVYVKDRWRKRGIGKCLVPRYPTYVTHMTKIGEELLKKFEQVTFNPFDN